MRNQNISASKPLKLMTILAHPDDESMGTGGILAKYAAEGVETYLITATRGERGWQGPEDDNPGLAELGRIRTAELYNAATLLGLREVSYLDYIDGDLDQADPDEAIRKIVAQIRRVQPQVVVTFDPFGAYGHPDHIAISQFTTAAITAAADPNYDAPGGHAPYRVSKLYYFVCTRAQIAAYTEAFGDLVMNIDGVDRRCVGWEDWAITTWVDTSEYWQQVWDAIACHRSQIPGFEALKNLPAERHEHLWGTQTFYRAYSSVNGGRNIERDLFEGIRNTVDFKVYEKSSLQL